MTTSSFDRSRCTAAAPSPWLIGGVTWSLAVNSPATLNQLEQDDANDFSLWQSTRNLLWAERRGMSVKGFV